MPLIEFVKIRLIRLYPLIVLGILCGFISRIGAFYHFSSHANEIGSRSSIFSAVLFGLLLLPYSGMYGADNDVFAVLVIFPVIVTLGVKDCITPKWRSVALFAGAMSCPVYVLHNATFVHFKHFQHHSKIELYMAFLVVFMAVVAMSYVALRFYDEPVRRWLTRIMRPSTRLASPR